MENNKVNHFIQKKALLIKNKSIEFLFRMSILTNDRFTVEMSQSISIDCDG